MSLTFPPMNNQATIPTTTANSNALDRGYLADFSVNASQSEIDQSSDEESNCGPPPQKKPSSIVSNDVFD